jgi:predicted house-cleaning noncanonical NTP pyrophosphatase (MazG superfamily)
MYMKQSRLVRDKISKVIEKKGEAPITHVADNEEYWQKLCVRLEEEMGEFLATGSKEEIADILQVIDAICEYKEFSLQELQATKKEKLIEKGAFKKRVIFDEKIAGQQDKPIVYFAGAIRGDRIAATTMRKLIVSVQDFGARVLAEHVASTNPVDNLPAAAIERRDIAWLDQATHVIAEISGASTGTGREIEYARTKHKMGKPRAKILCLYQREREFYASPMIRGMTQDRYPNVEVRSYKNINEAQRLIRDFLRSSQ